MRAKASPSLKLRKYSRKSRIAGDLSLMEVSRSSFGVLTRAKTLALQRLKKDSSPVPAAVDGVGGSYLHLRSGRLLKLSVLSRDRKKRRQLATKETLLSNPNPNLRNSPISTEFSVKNLVSAEEKEEAKINEKNDDANLRVEASFEGNALDVDGKERTLRESTPSSLVREADSMRTPGSTTKPASTTGRKRRLGSCSSRRHVPTTREIHEFFTVPAKEQQKQFMDKYNFDPVNEKPLPGRYKWEKVTKP